MAEFDPLAGARGPSAPGLTVDDVARLLGVTARIVEAELGGLGDELAGWHPGPKEWCANTRSSGIRPTDACAVLRAPCAPVV